MGTKAWFVLGALALVGCSAENALFNPGGEEAVAETGSIAMSAGDDSTGGYDSGDGDGDGDGDGGSSGGGSETGDEPEMIRCHSAIVDLINGCLHDAEISHPPFPIDDAYWASPTRDELLEAACTEGFGEFNGHNSFEFFGSIAPDYETAPEAYWHALCEQGQGPQFCEDGYEEFANKRLPECFEDFTRLQAFETFWADDNKVGAALEGIFEDFQRQNDGNYMEVLEYGPGMAPTAAGDLVRELLSTKVYEPWGGETIEPYYGVPYTDFTFQPELENAQLTLGTAVADWVVVFWRDIDPEPGCAEQTRALLAVHHEYQLVIKMVFPECTVE